MLRGIETSGLGVKVRKPSARARIVTEPVHDKRSGAVVGIDPGFSGAVAALLPDGEARVFDMPVVGTKKDKLIDGALILRELLQIAPSTIAVERVGAMPGQGVVSMFNFGVAFGTVLGLATATGARLILVPPAQWKRQYGLVGKPKEAAVREAYMRVPVARDYLHIKRGVTNKEQAIGRADALLIANYALTK